MAINAMSGTFPFEHSVFYNLVAFSIGGAVIGIVVGGFMAVSQKWLPFKRPFLNTLLLSISLWFILRIGGFFLSLNDPVRYHPSIAETLQGFVLAVILGCILGSLWEMRQRADY